MVATPQSDCARSGRGRQERREKSARPSRPADAEFVSRAGHGDIEEVAFLFEGHLLLVRVARQMTAHRIVRDTDDEDDFELQTFRAVDRRQRYLIGGDGML